MERITKVNRLIGALPQREPSADFERRMWERLQAESVVAPERRRRMRPALWGVPALAAAAALALAFYSSLAPAPADRSGGASKAVEVAGESRQAPRAPELARAKSEHDEAPRAEERRVASGQPDESPGAGERNQIASAGALAPEDLPPDLVEHPELFLRYPVVRRLDSLSHFEEVQQRIHPEGERPADAAPVG